MLVYLRKITNNDTKKQIETTAEAYELFFGGDTNNANGVTIPIENSGGTRSSNFKISKAGGKANSYRFSSAKGDPTIAAFIEQNYSQGYKANDIIKIEKKGNTYRLFLINNEQEEYKTLESMLINKQNTILVVEEKIEEDIFSHQWFAEQSKNYIDLDESANKALAEFYAKFSLNIIENLQGKEIITTLFLNNENTDNLCRVLEYDAKNKELFGSIAGGSAYKFGLFFSSDGYWTTGTSHAPKQLSEDEAIQLGSQIRDYLIAGANTIQKYSSLNNVQDYKYLHEELKVVTGGYIDKAWFLKYYYLIFPNLLAACYSESAQKIVLSKIQIVPEKYSFVRMGQIKLFIDECNISSFMFNKIFWDNYNENIVDIDETEYESVEINYKTNFQSEFARNRILFGAPGTGKSYTLNEECKKLLGEANASNYERVTFHPDYSYAQFVGTYKPVSSLDEKGHDIITYEYVPGPFTRTLVKALKNGMSSEAKPYLLIVEEINRANVAAVFGDVFQLLDRNDNEVSEYAIQTSEDMRKYLAKEIGGEPQDYAEIQLPNNMFIWSTMNSADQGVFPMDTAFKRRWEFTYIGINDSEEGIANKTVILGTGDNARTVKWNTLRKAINEELLKYKVNEDKLMGPYFISTNILGTGDKIDEVKFINTFKNKVLMYLFDDAAKQKRTSLFAGCEVNSLYSEICREFEIKGVGIFCDNICKAFNDVPVEDASQGE